MTVIAVVAAAAVEWQFDFELPVLELVTMVAVVVVLVFVALEAHVGRLALAPRVHLHSARFAPQADAAVLLLERVAMQVRFVEMAGGVRLLPRLDRERVEVEAADAVETAEWGVLPHCASKIERRPATPTAQ